MQNFSAQAATPHVAALRQELGLSPNLRLDWITSSNGTDTMRIVDNFDRDVIGDDWALDERYWAIKKDALVLTDEAMQEWRYLAVFKPIFNTPARQIHSVAYRWGKKADEEGIGEGAFALMITEPSPSGSGYWCWRRTNQNSVWLYAIKNGAWEYTPGNSKEYHRANSRQPVPQPGDYVEAVIYKKPDAVYFDYFVNGGFDATVYDRSKEFAQNATWYAGVFIHGQDLDNQVDDFTITWLGPDKIAPAKATDLRVADSSTTSIILKWTSPGDNYFEGRASRLEIRYSTAPLTPANFAAAQLAQNIPAPVRGGATQNFDVDGLNANTKYYFAVRVFDEVNNAGALSNVATARTQLPGNGKIVFLNDNFGGSIIDANKWNKGSNAGNRTVIESGALKLQSVNGQAGWVVTKNSYGGAYRIAKLKITQPSDDGALGMSPTVNAGSANAIYSQNNWYRFYVYRDGHAGKYLLFVQRKRNGTISGLDVGQGLTPPGVFYLRLRSDDRKIFFEYSPNDVTWTTVHQEAFLLPGYNLSNSFYYEISGNNTPVNGILKVDDFNLSKAAPAPDTQPPVITQVTTGSLATTTATITWATDELSDSQVEFGKTIGYGSSSPLNATLVKAHSMQLTNLAANTSYHYRVKSKDGAGNLATSNDFTFTTNPAGANLFSDNFNAATLDLGKWTRGGNSGNQASVVQNELELRSAGKQTAWIVTKQKFVARNTSVAVKITQPNNDGNLGMAPAFQVSSLNGIFPQANWYRFYVYRDVNSGPYRLYAQWSKNGAVNGLDVTGSINITGVVYLRLRFDASRIHFEASLNGQNWTDTYNEVFALPGHTLTSSFHYEVAGNWTEVKGKLTVDDFVIAGGQGLVKDGNEETPVDAELPMAFALSQSYPNPFHFNTHMRLALPEAAQVHAVIYDLNGRVVRELHQDLMPTGYRVINWDGANSAGGPASSGVYFMRVIFQTPAGQREVFTRQLQLMR